jgi:hypothetical protein
MLLKQNTLRKNNRWSAGGEKSKLARLIPGSASMSRPGRHSAGISNCRPRGPQKGND